MSSDNIHRISKSQIIRLSQNLKSLISQHEITESKIAQSLNIPLMTVRRLVSGETTDPRISTLKLFSDYFNVSIDSLIGDCSTTSNIGNPYDKSPRFVPIFDWNEAADLTLKDIDLRSWKNWQPVALGRQFSLSQNSFALTSKPSMQPRFPLGTIFIIDPNEDPVDGDLVLVQIENVGDITLRELVTDPPRWQLSAVTAGSEMLFYDKEKHKILGVVILTMLHSRKDK